MAQIILDDLDDRLVARLKSQASRHGRTLEGEVQIILEQQAGKVSKAEAHSIAEEWSRRLAGSDFSDSTEMIREDRER